MANPIGNIAMNNSDRAKKKRMKAKAIKLAATGDYAGAQSVIDEIDKLIPRSSDITELLMIIQKAYAGQLVCGKKINDIASIEQTFLKYLCEKNGVNELFEKYKFWLIMLWEGQGEWFNLDRDYSKQIESVIIEEIKSTALTMMSEIRSDLREIEKNTDKIESKQTWNMYRWFTTNKHNSIDHDGCWIIVATSEMSRNLKANVVDEEGYYPELCSLLPIAESSSLNDAIIVAKTWCSYTGETGVIYGNNPNNKYEKEGIVNYFEDGTFQIDLSKIDINGDLITRKTGRSIPIEVHKLSKLSESQCL